MTESGLADGRAVLMGGFARSCKPRKRLTVSAWSDRHRVLTGKSAQVSGQWRTGRMPHTEEPMDMLSLHSPAYKVVCMFPIQMAKTEMGLNFIGYTIDHAPAPMLSVQPTLELRDRYVLQRINPLLESTECIADKFSVKSRRDASNSRDLKDFPGGMLVLGGANSASSLSSMPIKNVVADEVDKFPHDLGGEGDPLGLIEGRQSNFSRSKILVISSPTMKDASLIEAEYLSGDQRKRFLPCPHCSEYIELKWKQLQWTAIDGVVKEVWYVCEHCGSEIEEHEKATMLAAGKWIAQKKAAPYPSYNINALYSPRGIGRTWTDLVYQKLAAQGDPIKEKRFANTRMAETYEDNRHSLKPSVLMERREDYALKTIPPGVLALTVGLDTQNDRLPLQLLGHGRGGRVWVLDYVELPGDPNNVVPDFIEKKGVLYDYVNQTFVNAWGKAMRIQAVGWDTGGHRTDAIYTACRSKVVSRLLAMKSWSIGGKPVLAARPSHQDVKWNGKINKRGVALWMVGSDTAKDIIIGHLVGDEEKSADDRMIHFSIGLDEDYFKMLLAEKFDPEKNRYVKKSGVRNESIDTFVYGIAAARHPSLRLHTKTKADWDTLEKMLQPTELVQGADGVYRAVDDASAPETVSRESSEPEYTQKRGIRSRRKGRRSGFAKNW